MKQTVTESMFVDAFRHANRAGQFSVAARRALFDYFTECEEGGEEVELDVIAICCDFAEYSDPREAAEEHGWEADADAYEDDAKADAMTWLQERTTVLECEHWDGFASIVIRSF
jgi:hypothetical protein